LLAFVGLASARVRTDFGFVHMLVLKLLAHVSVCLQNACSAYEKAISMESDHLFEVGVRCSSPLCCRKTVSRSFAASHACCVLSCLGVQLNYSITLYNHGDQAAAKNHFQVRPDCCGCVSSWLFSL
jgi:hypothetical protein